MMSGRSTREIRIILVLSELRPGGMERVVVHLAGEFKRRGIAVEVICLQNPGILAPLLFGQGIPVVSLKSYGSRDIAALWRLRKELRRFRSTVINLHDYASLPYVALANLLAVKRPLLFTAHGLLYEGFEPLQKRLRFFSHFLTSVSAVSEKVARRHREYIDWKKPVRTITNGVPSVAVDDESRSRVREELGCTNDTHFFLAIGNPRPEKGFEYLLDAAAMLQKRDARFLLAVAGNITDSQYCRDLMQKLERLKLGNNCRFLGFRQDTEALYSAADSFVLSSRSEGLPMVILEAMAAGLPVIATRVGGIPSAVGECVLLVDAQDSSQLAAAMYRMQNDSELGRSLALSGKNHVAKYYGIERMVDQYLGWYRQVMNGEC